MLDVLVLRLNFHKFDIKFPKILKFHRFHFPSFSLIYFVSQSIPFLIPSPVFPLVIKTSYLLVRFFNLRISMILSFYACPLMSDLLPNMSIGTSNFNVFS